MKVIYTIILFIFMAISPRAVANAAAGASNVSSTARTAASSIPNATTGPYTLSNAQAQGYTGGSSYSPQIVQPNVIGKPSANTAEGTTEYYRSMGYDLPSAGALSLNYSTKMANTSEIYNAPGGGTYYSSDGGKTKETPISYAPTKITTPKVTTPTVAKTTNAIKPIVQNYGSFFKSSAGDRNAYNTSVNYDKLSANQKRLADNVFNTSSTNAQKKKEEDEKKKLQVGAIDTVALIETPEQEKQRLLKESTEKEKQDAIDAKNAAIETKRLEKEALLTQDDTSIAELNAEQTKYTAEEEATAKGFEENRLNQVRGDIMQSLAARGVDISKLAPEQITALSGEQGVKAFTDIYTAKEKAKSNIKTARDKTMAELQRLRSNKNISQNAYNTQVASINELTNTKLREAENNYKNGVIGLIDKKIETGITTATTAVNFLQQAGIPLSEQSKFSALINSSKNAGDFLKAVITSTDPAIQKVYKERAAEIAAAAKAEFDLKVLQATPKGSSSTEAILDLVKTYQNQAINAKNTGDVQGAKDWSAKSDALLRSISGTQTVVQPSTVPPSVSIANPFSQFTR